MINSTVSKLSVVIPTRNRETSLLKCLASLSKESHLIDELIIVDSSDSILTAEKINHLAFTKLNIIESEPSVCIQRNIGIAKATNDLIFLCDDDIDTCEGYISTCKAFLDSEPNEVAVCGYFLERDGDGTWQYEYPVRNVFTLVWACLFQNSLWFDIEKNRNKYRPKSVFNFIHKKLLKHKNDFSKGGWPVNIQLCDAVNKVSIYSLGASLVRKEVLLNSPFDEVLDRHGLGDNYGVALGFPKGKQINILSHIYVHHYRSSSNRLQKSIAYFRRVLALHYFINQSERFDNKNERYFIFSLIGNVIQFALKFDFFNLKNTIKILYLILTNRNPYLLGKKDGKKIITPNP